MEKGKVSYFLNKQTTCPICETTHVKEELMTGRGRLIAGDLTGSLRRLYIPSQKWGKIFPLIYNIQVCPSCLYASFYQDFTSIIPEDNRLLEKQTKHRKNLMKQLFTSVDFTKERNLVLGVASYVLATDCYHVKSVVNAPTVKKALCTLRAAWLLEDLHEQIPYRIYDKIAHFYYLESLVLYNEALNLLTSKEEPVEKAFPCMAPALTNNWGFDNIIYLSSYLNYKYLDKITSNHQQKLEILEKSRKSLSKLYGSGSSSSAMPAIVLNKVRKLYEDITSMIHEINPSEANLQSQK